MLVRVIKVSTSSKYGGAQVLTYSPVVIDWRKDGSLKDSSDIRNKVIDDKTCTFEGVLLVGDIIDIKLGTITYEDGRKFYYISEIKKPGKGGDK